MKMIAQLHEDQKRDFEALTSAGEQDQKLFAIALRAENALPIVPRAAT